jgi:hypothetical protein
MIEAPISKTAFAEAVRVTPARVSQWLAEKKIFGDAIVGEGRSARIRASLAVQQLQSNLNFDRRICANSSAKLDGIFPFSPIHTRDPIEEQIKRERLETARRTNRKMAGEEAARNGRYVLSEDARRSTGKAIVQVISSTEGWCSELASAIAAKFSIPQRDVLHLVRAEFRNFRAGLGPSFQQSDRACGDAALTNVGQAE